VPRAETWAFHVGDQGIARAVGLRAPAVAAGVPGRMRVVESGLEGQVVHDPEPLRGIAVDNPGVGPGPVLVLPEVIDADDLDARWAAVPQPGRPVELLIGVGADDLGPAVLRVPVGDHVFIGGGAHTGRSTALRQVEAAWRRTHQGCPVLHVERAQPLADLDGGVGEVPVLVVVDDAERIDDLDGGLARLIARPDVTFAIAARLEAVRVAYGHWTRNVARSHCGLIMTSMGDVDGELLGANLPRRPWIAPRAGLAWMVDQGGHRLVQVAARMPP
jgi:S-DNA-T family DNA segregation ATPase FtsK/SpoIIIE